ncbi:hypothetical protein GG496_000885, partial [Candidatus Fervidibacteria bacterium JGI MDM2 JNZ-1-D12]
MEPVTIVTAIVANALSGIIGNRADDIFCSIVGRAVVRWLNSLLQRESNAINFQNSIHQAAIEATLDVVNDCLRELPSHPFLDRFPRKSPDETRRWLEDAREGLSEELKRAKRGEISWQVSEEAQRQVKILLQPKRGVLGSKRAEEFAKRLTDLLLSDLTNRFGEPPEIFVQKVEQVWFERFCAFFSKKLQEQPELKSFLQTQILATIKDDLAQLGEKVEEVLSAMLNWVSLLSDIDRRLREIEQLTEVVRKEIGIVRRDVREILRILQNQLGSEHIVIALRERMEKFVSDLSAQPFIGRRKPLQRLEEFVNGQKKGVAIVYAPAGYGKTILLANWLKGVRSKPNFAVAYHFFNRHPDLGGYATSLNNALAHLIGQIWAMTQRDGSPLSLPNDPNERRAVLENMLAHLQLDEGEKLILVLDGLDEAEPILEYPPIPFNLPDGVFFVVAGRWDGVGKIPTYLEGWARFTEFIPLHALSLDELREWLKVAGEGELARFAEDEGFVSLLHQKTDGLPLYVRYLLDDLVELARQGRDVKGALERKPKGFREYVREQLRQLASVVRNERGVREMFALLTQAKGALRESELEELAGLSAWDLQDLPLAVMRWFSVGQEDGERTFAFAHQLLAEEFGEVLGREAEQARVKLIEWCGRWEEHKSRYALRYLAHHLYDMVKRESEAPAEPLQSLFDLARNEKLAM